MVQFTLRRSTGPDIRTHIMHSQPYQRTLRLVSLRVIIGEISRKAVDHANLPLLNIVVIADTDVPLLQELVAQKAYASGLKVVIAVGGWTFSWVIRTSY